MMFAQDHIFCDGEIPDHAIAHSFFGDIGQHSVGQITGRKASDILPLQKDMSAGYFSQTCNGLRQFALTITGNTGDPQDFT